MPAPHPPEFRQRAVELARSGDKPVAQVAKSLGISESCLRNWIAQTDVDEGGSSASLTSSEKKELSELRKRSRSELSSSHPAAPQTIMHQRCLMLTPHRPPKPGTATNPGRRQYPTQKKFSARSPVFRTSVTQLSYRISH